MRVDKTPSQEDNPSALIKQAGCRAVRGRLRRPRLCSAVQRPVYVVSSWHLPSSLPSPTVHVLGRDGAAWGAWEEAGSVWGRGEEGC